MRKHPVSGNRLPFGVDGFNGLHQTCKNLRSIKFPNIQATIGGFGPPAALFMYVNLDFFITDFLQALCNAPLKEFPCRFFQRS